MLDHAKQHVQKTVLCLVVCLTVLLGVLAIGPDGLRDLTVQETSQPSVEQGSGHPAATVIPSFPLQLQGATGSTDLNTTARPAVTTATDPVHAVLVTLMLTTLEPEASPSAAPSLNSLPSIKPPELVGLPSGCPALGAGSHGTNVVTKAGLSVHYVTGSHGWFWQLYPRWEAGTFRVFERFAPGRVVLDVGAWIGPTVLWEAQVARAVVALEPTEVAFRALCASLAVNPSLASRVAAVHAALDERDGTVRITNRGDSMDRFLSSISVRAVSIATLRLEQPVLEGIGFVKIDTEGYERVLVPALKAFFLEKRPVVYVSLHSMFISHDQVQSVVDTLKQTFPYLYEQDMRTPFNSRRSHYDGGDHGGVDVLCTWAPL